MGAQAANTGIEAAAYWCVWRTSAAPWTRWWHRPCTNRHRRRNVGPLPSARNEDGAIRHHSNQKSIEHVHQQGRLCWPSFGTKKMVSSWSTTRREGSLLPVPHTHHLRAAIRTSGSCEGCYNRRHAIWMSASSTILAQPYPIWKWFPYVWTKYFLRQHFHSDDELRQAVHEWLHRLPKEYFYGNWGTSEALTGMHWAWRLCRKIIKDLLNVCAINKILKNN